MAITPSPEQISILNELRDAVVENSKNKGFRNQLAEDMTPEQWNGRLGRKVRASVMTANQHSETSEFWEAFRDGKLDAPCSKAPKMEAMGLPGLTCGEEEVADEIIRALDKAEAHGIDVAKAVSAKMAYNSGRPQLHGGKQA